jgi:hypothetical protein
VRHYCVSRALVIECRCRLRGFWAPLGESTTKSLTAAFALALAGCGSVPSLQVPAWMHGPEVSESTCTAACDAHFAQCPQIFAGFPQRGAVECPAEHNNCLRSCATRHPAVRTAPTSPVAPLSQTPATPPDPGSAPQALPGTVHVVSSKEARLRELKHLYDEGLVTDDVYRDRQRAILSEP